MAKRGVLEHEKTIELAVLLDIPECYALGILEAFWHWVAKYRPTGSLADVNPALMARAIRYPGDAAQLWACLMRCGWIEEGLSGQGLIVHDWSEHADNTVQKALKDRGQLFADGTAPFAKRLNRAKRSDHDSVVKSHNSVTTRLQQNVTETSLPDTRYQIPDTRELNTSCSEASSEPPDETPVFLELPCTGKRQRFAVRESLIASCNALYPAVDVRQEIRNIRGWLDGSPSRRKTFQGVPRFIHAWLSRSQDRGGRSGITQQATGAVGRVERTQSAFRRAALASAAAATRELTGADGGQLATPGDSGGHGPNVSARDGAVGSGVRAKPPAIGLGVVPNSLEVLSSPNGSPRGA